MTEHLKIQPMRRTERPRRIHYPVSDGQPMADSDDQYEAMTDGKFALARYFRNDLNVYVAANVFIYYEKGDPSKRVAPDIFVVFGVPKRNRGSYKLWLERKLPAIVFEVASPGTWRKDIVKKSLYERLQIPEYVMFDPFGEYFDDVLSGYRLTNGSYQSIPTFSSEDGKGIYSEQLGLEIWAHSGTFGKSNYIFRFRNPRTGEWLLSIDEADDAREAEAEARAEAERQAQIEAEARANAEAKLAQLEAELARLRGK